MKKTLHIFVILLMFLGGLAIPVHAQADVTVVSDQAILSFPDTVDFKAEFTSAAQITAVVLEYGVDQLTCGTVIAQAFPTVTPGTDVTVEWTWEMRQSGSVPPGATIWWRWQVSGSGGAQFTSPQKTVLWLDNTHDWQEITGGGINLHYYEGGASFGGELHDAAAQALTRLSQDVGITTDKPVDIYIYANTDDMKASILYEPSWVGGEAFAETNIVIIAVSTDQLDWGKSTEAHELTHVLVGHLTFSCLGFIPTWLNEGLAMYGEGGPGAAEQNQFDQAKTADQLPSLRSLAGGFSEESDRATLSYTEAYSVVNFMIQTYGQDKMITLLLDLRDGQATDDALQAVYGFDTDGLEDAWRASIGAAARPGSANPTPLATLTNVPTIAPIGAAPTAQAVASTPHPTQAGPTLTLIPADTPAATPAPPAPPGNTNTMLLVGIGLACVLAVLAVIVVVVVLASRRSK